MRTNFDDMDVDVPFFPIEQVQEPFTGSGGLQEGAETNCYDEVRFRSSGRGGA